MASSDIWDIQRSGSVALAIDGIIGHTGISTKVNRVDAARPKARRRASPKKQVKGNKGKCQWPGVVAVERRMGRIRMAPLWRIASFRSIP